MKTLNKILCLLIILIFSIINGCKETKPSKPITPKKQPPIIEEMEEPYTIMVKK